MVKKLSLTGAFMLTLALSSCAPDHSRPDRTSDDPPPSIIVILIDTLRADYLGAYGFEGDISPHLDRFAEESVLFRRCIAQAPWTKPSVASLFTSMHPLTHRVLDHDGKYWRRVGGKNESSALPDSAATLAEMLKSGGYRTAAWSGSYWITGDLGFDQGFEEFQGTVQAEQNILDADLLLDPARDWLARVEPHQPFFLYLHLMDVHSPWEWSEPDWQAVKDSPSLGIDRALNATEQQRLMPQIRGNRFPSALRPRLRTWRGVYAAGVRTLDRKLGRFLDYLGSSGLLRNTIVVITADHGEELVEHGRWGHGRTLHAHQTRVPLIVRMPGPSGKRRDVERVVSLIDIMPTLLSAGQVKSAPEEMQGEDLWDLLSGTDEQGPGLGFSGAVIGNTRMVSIVDSAHRLIWEFPDGTMQLYDTEGDPDEQTNIESRETAARDRLARDLTGEMTDLLATPTLLKTTGDLSDEDLERLRSLGYVQ